MAARFPLIANSSSDQIQELASGDDMELTGNSITGAGIITATTFSGNITGNVTGNVTGNTSGTAGGLTGTPDISCDLVTAADVQVSGACTIVGNLTVDGTQTIINTDTLDVSDKTVGIASTTNATDTTADGSGLEIYASSSSTSNNKTLKWSSTGYNWTFAKGGLVVSQGGLNVTGVATITGIVNAGSDVRVTGNLNAGITTLSGAVKASDTTESTTKDTGAVIVEGGVGIEKNLNVGGMAVHTGIATFTAAIDVNTASDIAGLTVSSTTDSTTKDTGALIVEGGLGVEKSVNVSTTINLDASSGIVTATGFEGPTRTVPINTQGSTYTLVKADCGKFINASDTVTVPASIFAIGDVVSVWNDQSGSNLTITQGSSTTLHKSGENSDGSQSIAPYGVCTILCVGSDEFVVSGSFA